MAENEEASPLMLEIEEIKKELAVKSKDELIDELAFYRHVIPKLGPWVEWIISNFYKVIGVRWRMGREAAGVLIGAIVHPDILMLLTTEEIRKYEQKKIIFEQHIVYAPVKELTWYDVILGKIGEEEMKI